MASRAFTDEKGRVVRVEGDEVITPGDERHGLHGLVQGPQDTLSKRFEDEKPAPKKPAAKKSDD